MIQIRNNDQTWGWYLVTCSVRSVWKHVDVWLGVLSYFNPNFSAYLLAPSIVHHMCCDAAGKKTAKLPPMTSVFQIAVHYKNECDCLNAFDRGVPCHLIDLEVSRFMLARLEDTFELQITDAGTEECPPKKYTAAPQGDGKRGSL